MARVFPFETVKETSSSIFSFSLYEKFTLSKEISPLNLIYFFNAPSFISGFKSNWLKITSEAARPF